MQCVIARALGDHAPQAAVDGEDLKHRAAAARAGVIALLAARAAVKWHVRVRGQVQQLQLVCLRAVGRFAVRADAPHQPLGDDAAQGVCDEIRLHADVQQPVDGRHGVVRMERGQNEVACDGGADGDGARLAVADLAHGDDVRVLPQNGAQAGGKRHARFFVDLALVHTRDVILHRVLQRHNVRLLRRKLLEHGA